MPQTRTVPTAWIHTKVCPCCGYRGTEVQAVEETGVFECPVCANDLYARPPMTYAEMEGLAPLFVTGRASVLHSSTHPGRPRHQRTHGWLMRLWSLLRRVLPIRA